MKLVYLLILMAILYIGLLFMALMLTPPESFVTDDWRKAREYVDNCVGYAEIEQTLDGFEVKCYE